MNTLAFAPTLPETRPVSPPALRDSGRRTPRSVNPDVLGERGAALARQALGAAREFWASHSYSYRGAAR